MFLTRVWGPRAQIDRKLYKKNIQDVLHNYPNLDTRAGSVFDIVIDQSDDTLGRWGKLSGVKLGTHVATQIIFRFKPPLQIRGRSSLARKS